MQKVHRPSAGQLLVLPHSFSVRPARTSLQATTVLRSFEGSRPKRFSEKEVGKGEGPFRTRLLVKLLNKHNLQKKTEKNYQKRNLPMSMSSLKIQCHYLEMGYNNYFIFHSSRWCELSSNWQMIAKTWRPPAAPTS